MQLGTPLLNKITSRGMRRNSPGLPGRRWANKRISKDERKEVNWSPPHDIPPLHDTLSQRMFRSSLARF